MAVNKLAKNLHMKTAHRGMNISEMEFNAVVGDVIAAVDNNAVAQQEKNEILAILCSVRDDVVNFHLTARSLIGTEHTTH